MPFRSSYRLDRHEINPAPDPAVGPDPWLGLPVYTFQWLEPASGQIRDGVSQSIEVTVWDNPAFIRVSYDGVNYYDQIEVDNAHQPAQWWFAARTFQVRNATAGNDARIQVVGMW